MTEPPPHRRPIGRAFVTLLAVWAVLPAMVAIVSGSVETPELRASECSVEIQHGDRDGPNAPPSDFGVELEEEQEEEDERSRRRLEAAEAFAFSLLTAPSLEGAHGLVEAERDPISRRRGAPSGRDPPRA